MSAAILFSGPVVVAALVASPVDPSVPGLALLGSLMAAVLSLPGLALLGAGLTSAALGSRSSAASAGLAMGVGVPVAAVTSAMIGAFVVVAFYSGAGRGADVAGALLRAGVGAAVRISPLIAVASVAWVLLVRRLAGIGPLRAALRPGRGPRRRGG